MCYCTSPDKLLKLLKLYLVYCSGFLQAKAAILSVSLVLETPGWKGSEVDTSSSSDDDEVEDKQADSRVAQPQRKTSVQFGGRRSGQDGEQGGEEEGSDAEEQEGRHSRENEGSRSVFAARTPSKTKWVISSPGMTVHMPLCPETFSECMSDRRSHPDRVGQKVTWLHHRGAHQAYVDPVPVPLDRSLMQGHHCRRPRGGAAAVPGPAYQLLELG
jgi:hypothetical protein